MLLYRTYACPREARNFDRAVYPILGSRDLDGNINMGHEDTSGARDRPASPQSEDPSESMKEVGFWNDCEETYDFPSAVHLDNGADADAATAQHVLPIPAQEDPYALVSVLQMHAGMFSNKGWGTFRLVYGKKPLLLDKMNERKFVTWRASDQRQVTYTSKAKDTKLSTGFLTDANEFDKMLDLIIQAKEHEGLFQQPSWQKWSDLVGPPPEEPLSTDGRIIHYLRACVENNYFPTSREVEREIRIPKSTVQRNQYWQNYLDLRKAERDRRERSYRRGDVVAAPNQEVDE